MQSQQLLQKQATMAEQVVSLSTGACAFRLTAQAQNLNVTTNQTVSQANLAVDTRIYILVTDDSVSGGHYLMWVHNLVQHKTEQYVGLQDDVLGSVDLSNYLHVHI